ncbi:MAG: bile acid:sodium symporter family protein [Planctomycetales bacterium]|nr:bile acid:sodium symporter family protein [Planctomycetales bacterium]
MAATAAGCLATLAAAKLTSTDAWQLLAVFTSVGAALGLAYVPSLRGYQFTAWIVAAVVAALAFPAYCLHVGTFDLRNPRLLLLVVQLVMFGMGTQMTWHDFTGVLRMPGQVGIGLVCQFTIMPLVGFALTKLIALPPEVAAGIILIGSCSSGLASNVMVYVARGNLPLSITLTAVATLLAPLMTPLWMKLLANELVAVSFLKMMQDILKMVIVPIGAALIHDALRPASARTRHVVTVVAAVAAFVALLPWLVHSNFVQIGSDSASNSAGAAKLFVICWPFVQLSLAMLVAGTLYHWVTRLTPSITNWMPRLSMFGIIYFTAVTTAAGRDDLLQVGGWLFLAALLHNGLGYVFGYGLSRLAGLNRDSARTIAFEVGLQNGGMASGLAAAMGKLGTVGLAAAIFSPWMNVTGSLLANQWRKQATTSSGDAST